MKQKVRSLTNILNLLLEGGANLLNKVQSMVIRYCILSLDIRGKRI